MNPTTTRSLCTPLAAAFALVLLGSDLHAQAGRSRGVSIGPGESCPPGTTEIRPRTCMGPEMPAPSILDYRPRSTLVVPEHPVPRAKFPVIDSHNHTTITAANIDQMVKDMDALNLRVLVNLSGGNAGYEGHGGGERPGARNRRHM